MSASIFIHGLESSNQGTKAVYFRERFPDMLVPNFPGTLEKRMARLEDVLKGKGPVRLVGSSFGGLMASIFAMENEARVESLILLAPAINLVDFTDYQKRAISVPVRIYHGIRDEVIPLDAVQRVAFQVFRHLTFQLIEDDHPLHETFPTMDWTSLLNETAPLS